MFGWKMLVNSSTFSLISIVLPAFNEGEALQRLIPALVDALKNETIEIIVVDDGSNDGTRNAVLFLKSRWPMLRYVRFSRNFGKEAALSAGLRVARGDAVILMDSDGQHPPALLKTFLERWRSGAEVVCGVQTQRDETAAKRLAKRIYYRLMENGSSITIPPNAGDFRLLSRNVVDAINAMPERKRFMKGLYAWVGFRTEMISFTAAPRVAGKSKFGWLQLFKLGLTGVTAFTIAPLRIVSILGFIISASSFLFGAYLLAEFFLVGNQLPGWATLAVGMTFFSGLQLLALGFIAEYIAGMYEELKQRPLYIIAEDTAVPAVSLVPSEPVVLGR
jgi:glycosyltransferase involved in cell wall biosynthesis